ncbi:MAG: cytochrome c maturation protein CcmE [Thermaurantiacus sp.]
MSRAAAASVRSAKKQRLVLGLLALFALLAAGVFGLFALQSKATFFYAPSDIAANPPPPGAEIRLGGLVKEGSILRRSDGLTLDFVVTDRALETPVSYRGLVPDLFKEGQGVIATGRLGPDGHFEARELLARHDENYMPPEVAAALQNTGAMPHDAVR